MTYKLGHLLQTSADRRFHKLGHGLWNPHLTGGEPLHGTKWLVSHNLFWRAFRMVPCKGARLRLESICTDRYQGVVMAMFSVGSFAAFRIASSFQMMVRNSNRQKKNTGQRVAVISHVRKQTKPRSQLGIPIYRCRSGHQPSPNGQELPLCHTRVCAYAGKTHWRKLHKDSSKYALWFRWKGSHRTHAGVRRYFSASIAL